MKSVKNLNNVKNQLAACNSKAVVGGTGVEYGLLVPAVTTTSSYYWKVKSY